MKNEQRVLAYNKSEELPDEILQEVGGGAALEVSNTTRILSGGEFGRADVTIDQIWS